MIRTVRTAGSATSGERLVIVPCKARSDHSQVWLWVGWSNDNTVQGHCYGTSTQDWVLDI